MIAYIIGKITDISEDSVVIETNGMGFNVFVASGYQYSIGQNVKIYTYTNVKEDAFSLFGFEDKEQLVLFKMLLTVNGIGPKGALAILSCMSTTDLRFAIYHEDAGAIAKANGIGKKTAERVILDLKDKIKLSDSPDMPSALLKGNDVALTGFDEQRRDAIEALTALGYSSGEAVKAVSKVEMTDGMTADAILKQSLKYLF